MIKYNYLPFELIEDILKINNITRGLIQDIIAMTGKSPDLDYIIENDVEYIKYRKFTDRKNKLDSL